MREIAVDTARGTLAALRGGQADGPKLLCLHGWLDNAASFQPLAPHLAAFDWVALDLPGHGGSAHRPPGCDYAFADWLHDVLDALDSLGWHQADLLGHSMGGAIASFVAAAAPSRVRRLALVEALGPVAGGAKGFPAALQTIGIHIHQGADRPCPGKALRHGQADAAGRAGDHDDFAAECPSGHQVPPSP